MECNHNNSNQTTKKDKEQDLVEEYINQMSAREKKAYHIASNHLKTSFNILLSNGFKEWKKKNDTSIYNI